MLPAAATVLCAVISMLMTGLVIVAIGDAVERRRYPDRGFATFRAMRADAVKVATAARRQLTSIDINVPAVRRRPRRLSESTE